jgi:glycosyltransferase involved in cell wall biosynthesis
MQTPTSSLPLVSIVVPTYNREKWVGEAIKSALAQDYQNYEVVICDDGSTDDSNDVIKLYCHDPRVKYFKNERNLGLIENFNKIFFELAQGEFITLLGSDDYFINASFLTKSIDIIRRYDNVATVFGKTSLIDEKTGVITSSTSKSRFDIEFRRGHEVFMEFAERPYYSSGAVLYSLRHLKQNGIRFSGRMTADIEMNLQLMLVANVGYIDENCYMIRQHDANASTSLKKAKDVEFSYLDLVVFLRDKAKTQLDSNKNLCKWYRSVIATHINHSLNIINTKGNRKQVIELQRILFKKYPSHYLKFLLTHPKQIVKIAIAK